MLRWLHGCCLVVLAACGFGAPAGTDGPPPDAPPDLSTERCFGSFVQVCLVTLPSAPLTVNSNNVRRIETAAGSPDCVATMPTVDACVVAATSITVNGTIRGTGQRPLILLATGAFQINSTGVIDVSSRRGIASGVGAGANASRCVNGTPPAGRSGGWGGTNATRGGNSESSSGSGSTASTELPQPTALFGGCAGGRGASGGGASGDGGGAVSLIAATLMIDGVINASGAGAAGAITGNRGGGGGGSGGMIVLDARDVMFNSTARVFAQGGGGGEGSTDSGGGDGLEPTAPEQEGAGGSGNEDGGNGGDGATTDNGGLGEAGESGGGGGGGGGGAGFIKTTDPSPPAEPTTRVCPPLS
jgi:hypothetical protein